MCKKKGRKFVGFDPISRIHFGLLWCGGFGGMEKNKKSASPKKTAPMARRTASCVATPGGGWIAFLGVSHSHDMAGAGG